MTKKAKIIKMFDGLEWMQIHGQTLKIIEPHDIEKIGLYHCWEYGETYNDVIYMKRIFKSMGYRVLIGSLMWVIKI